MIKGDHITKGVLLAIGLMFLVVLSGCAIGESVVLKAATVITKPIFGLAVKDAKTTLEWVEEQEKSGNLGQGDVLAAKQCPEAVLALDELRTKMTQATQPDGFKGLIYHGTINKFGQGVQAEATQHLSQLARECLPLIPAEKLIKLF